MRSPRALPCIATVVLALTISLSVGCKRAPQPASIGSTGELATDMPSPALSEAEQRYGVSPTRSKEVTYQPDVIVMEHGADAIRSQSTNGFTWTIDAGAPGASQIQPDKILFATGRVVGRVLKVERKGDNLDVTLGPAELTDIFEEVHISTRGSMDPEKMLVYVAPPGYPGLFHDRDTPEDEAPPVANTAQLRHSAVQVYTVSRDGDLIPLDSTIRRVQGVPCTDGGRGQFRAMQTLYVSGVQEPPEFNGDCARFMKVGASAADIAGVVLDGFDIRPSMAGGL